MLERLFALVLLATLVSTMMLIGLFIGVTAGGPIFVSDSVMTDDGALARSHRFRTTGPGAPIFHAVGRLLRRYDLDEFPTLWSVVRGDLSLRDLRFLRRR